MDSRSAVEYIEKRGLIAIRIRELPASRFQFTHVEWHMTGFEIRVAPASMGEEDAEEEAWIFADNEELLEKYAIPSACSAYMELLG